MSFINKFFFSLILLGSPLVAAEDLTLWLDKVPKEYEKAFLSFLDSEFEPEKVPPEWAHTKNNTKIFHLKLPSDIENCRGIGYCHKSNLTVFHGARTKEEVLFFTKYNFGADGLRVVEDEPKPNQTEHLILAGGSFVLGTSLAYEDTMAALVAQKSDKYFPKTLAVAGSGPNTLLSYLEERIDISSVVGPEGVFVLVYNDFFIERANGFALERLWLESSMVYKKEKEGLKKKGSFKEVEPTTTKVFGWIRKLFHTLELPYNFPRRGQKHINYTCELIIQLQKEYLKKFPKGKFFVYDHPYSKMDKRLGSCLAGKGIAILESSLQWDKSSYQIPYDEHPNRQGNIMVINELLAILP